MLPEGQEKWMRLCCPRGGQNGQDCDVPGADKMDDIMLFEGQENGGYLFLDLFLP